MTDPDPLERRVLAALRTGVESPGTVSSRLGVAREDVATVLDRGVLDGLVTRLDLAGTPVYSLTPAGLDLVGRDDAPEPPDQPATGDVTRATEVVGVLAEPVREVADVRAATDPPQAPVERHVRDQERAARKRPESTRIVRRHVVYAVAYVVLGLAFVVLLHAWVGLLAVVGGLGLGAFALRPLLRAADASAHD